MVVLAGSRAKIQENHHNEFKMHIRLSLPEIPPKCVNSELGRIVRTMQPASKTISAFLNTHGGRIFIGIDDDGVVKGIRMTKNMIDHFYLSLHHCLGQFNPPVPPHLVKVRFEELVENEDKVDKEKYEYGSDDDFSDDGDVTEQKPLSEWFMQEHLVGGKKCDCQLMTLNKSRLYLLIMQIFPSDDGTIYQNEEGLAYRRRNVSNKMLTIDELRQFIDTEYIELDTKPFWSVITEYIKSFF